MAANKKLTGVIRGRTIKTASAGDGVLKITFDDNSAMKIKTGTATAAQEALSGHIMKSVRQQGTTMNLDFTDGSSVPVTLAEATSSVMLRDGQGALEYAD